MMTNTILNKDVNVLLDGFVNMLFYQVCKKTLFNGDNAATKESLLTSMMQTDEEYSKKNTSEHASLEAYCSYLNENFPLEFQFEIYNTIRLLSDAFRDEIEAEQIDNENLHIIFQAAAIFSKYEKANGKDFFEFVCEYLEKGEDISLIIDKMIRYFRLKRARKQDNFFQEILINRLKKENKNYLPIDYFEGR